VAGVAFQHDDLLEIFASAPAAVKPPIPAPTTTACLPIRWDAIPVSAGCYAHEAERRVYRTEKTLVHRCRETNNFKGWMTGTAFSRSLTREAVFRFGWGLFLRPGLHRR